MKVLYLTYDGLTDPLGQSQVLPYLCGLSSKGHAITIVSFEKEKNFAAGKEHIQKIVEKNNLHWHPLSYTKSPPVLSTIYDITRLKRKCNSLQRENSFDLVHCRSYITAFAGLMMKKKYGTKFIFDMRGFYADERVDGGLWKLSNPVYKKVYDYFKRKEKEFLNHADYTICLTHKAQSTIQSWNFISRQPIPVEVIPCCVDTALFSRSTINSEKISLLKKEIGIAEDDFVLSYLGALGTWYLADEMLDFFSQLQQRIPKSKFLFITPDERENILSAASKKNIFPKNIIVHQASRAEVPLWLSLSNASIFFIKPVFSKSASSPTKQGEIMSMEIPIICNANIGDTDDIIRKYHAGIIIENFSAEDYSKAIDQLMQLSSFNKTEARQGALEYFSLEKGIEKYQCVYEKVFEK